MPINAGFDSQGLKLKVSETKLGIGLANNIDKDTIALIRERAPGDTKEVLIGLSQAVGVMENILTLASNLEDKGETGLPSTIKRLGLSIMSPEERALMSQYLLEKAASQEYTKVQETSGRGSPEAEKFGVGYYSKILEAFDRSREAVIKKFRNSPLTNIVGEIRNTGVFTAESYERRLVTLEKIANAVFIGKTDKDPLFPKVEEDGTFVTSEMRNYRMAAAFSMRPAWQSSDSELAKQGYRKVMHEDVTIRSGNILNDNPELAARAEKAVGAIKAFSKS